MRELRLKKTKACFHVYGRVLEKSFRLNTNEKNAFRNLMYQVAFFSGVLINEFTLMDNHFHILVYIPEPEDISKEELYRRVVALFGPEKADRMFKKWDHWRETDQSDRVKEEKERLLKRMYDISQFMKTLLERYTASFNRRHSRTGTLWEGRFNSVLVEPNSAALLGTAAYIATNCTRANIVKKPSKYRWSGYAEAKRGNKLARRGIAAMYGKDLDAEPEAWENIDFDYTGRVQRKAIEKRTKDGKLIESTELDAATINKVLREGGQLSHAQVLCCRIRYYTYGRALGSKEFIESLYRDYPEHFGYNRTPVPVRNLPIKGLYTASGLRKTPIMFSQP